MGVDLRTSLECIPCYVRQAIDATRMVTSDENVVNSVLKKVLVAISEFDISLTPPEIGQIVHRIIREESENPDPYFELKENSTKRALELSGNVEKLIFMSKSPFETAVRFSIAGNILDFGMKTEWDESRIMDSFTKAESHDLNTDMVNNLYDEISKAKRVLFLGDNAGEAVFDRMLIENFPGNAEVFYAVKGSPVINDVVFHDASQAGISSVANIIDNGADIQGTVLNQCSENFMDHYNNADVIIAKGQGNFETLNEENRRIYFLLQVKCEVIADHYEYNQGDWLVTTTDEMLKRER